MISYLEKFNNLPKELKDKVSSHAVMEKIGAVEKKYGVSLASVIMRLMVKDLKFSELSDFFVKEDGLEKRLADEIVTVLRGEILKPVLSYLGVDDQKKEINHENSLPVPLDEVPKYFGNNKSREQEGQQLNQWMKNRKSDMSSRSSGFFFSPEDEEEVRELAKKVAGFSGKPKSKSDLKESLDKILKEAGVNFSSEDMQRRFEQVMRTYLHGVRNRIDTKQTLIKSVEVGGLGIDDKQADKILQEASKFRREPDQPTLQKTKTSQSSVSKDEKNEAEDNKEMKKATTSSGDVDYDFESLIRGGAKSESKQPEEVKPVEVKKEEVAPLKREKSTYVEAENKGDKDDKEEFIDLTKLENLKDDRAVDIGKKMRAETMTRKGQDGDINIIQARAAAAADGRIRMEDVKHVPKLTGPIDELREMNVVNFRRLNSNPREAVLKIKKKIAFLEEESYTKRFEGIKAWRQSPVNKLYLEIGQESIINKKPVNVIINNRRQARKPFLSEAEFKAVMDLNKDLRF